MSTPAQPPAIAELLSGLSPLSFKAGSSLVAPGTMDASLWWIESRPRTPLLAGEGGLVRNHDFIEPGNWAYGSLTWNQGELCCGGTALGVEALADTVALRLPLTALQHARLASPSVAQWAADEMMRHSSRQMQRETALLQFSAEERYLAFLSERPALAGRIAQHHIAAWLGITPVGLSRIRSRLKDARTIDPAWRRRGASTPVRRNLRNGRRRHSFRRGLSAEDACPHVAVAHIVMARDDQVREKAQLQRRGSDGFWSPS